VLGKTSLYPLVFECLNAKVCFGVDFATRGAHFVFTFDGGRSWRQTTPDADMGVSPSVTCTRDSICLIGGNEVYRTTNWGKTGSEVLGAPKEPMGGPGGGNEISVSCPGAEICYAAGAAGSANGLVAKSKDAGLRWNIDFESPTANIFDALACPSTLTCYASGQNIDGNVPVYKTVDGGRKWTVTNIT
jgi:photosystem II stability/assembly factor-like uncharacterized protein